MNALVIGGNFAGITAALELKRKLGAQAEVTVVDPHDDFLFVPSLIWVPFRRRNIEDITVSRRSILDPKGIRFVRAKAESVDPDTKTVQTTAGEMSYDHLIIATGPKPDFDVAPGVREHSVYIGDPIGAMKTREKLDAFLLNPGPMVIMATQRAGCMGAAYEFLFNLEEWLRAKGVRKQVDLHWVTPETYLGHFGIDGMPGAEPMLTAFMKMFRIHYHTEAALKEVLADRVLLDSGEEIASRFTMVMPPFRGVEFITDSPKLGAMPNGFLAVGDDYRHPVYPEIWAAGLTVDVPPPFKAGKVPFNSPKTGYPSDVTGKIVAENIVRVMNGRKELKKMAWGRIPGLCVMDAGKKEVLLVSNHLFKPRQFAVLIPNVFYDVTKLFLEKYFLWKMRHGYGFLP